MTNPTPHADIEELLGAYALDAVDPDEREAVERHLLTCPRCRAEVQEHREVAALLAYEGSTAPPQLWDRIAGSLDTAPPAMQLTSTPPDELAGRRARRAGWGARVAVAVAAVAAAVVAVLGVQVRDLRHRNDRVEAALAANGDLLAMDELMAKPDTRLVPLSGPNGQGALAVVGPDGHGYLAAERLPALANGRTYQLWGRSGNALVSLGVLGQRPQVVPFQATGDISAFAVTAERSPGVVSSRQAPVVAGAIRT